MIRGIVLVLVFAAMLPAATVRLYLKDGGYHKVTEYQKQSDRVRFYSAERSQWEEIPLELVDLKKTEAEIAANEADRRENAKLQDAEEAADRKLEEEIARIPWEAGVFVVENEKVKTLTQAESKIVNNKRRSVLKILTPIPVVSGKATVEVDGPQAGFAVTGNRPEFYIRSATDERLVLVRAEPTKESRIVQRWDIVPVTKEIVEKTDVVETFRQQLADGLHKIWPTQPLEAGEYAVVQYTEGKGNIQIWDFRVSEGGPKPAAR